MAERTEKFDEKIKTRLVAKDTDLEVMKEQPYWNRLSLNENDEEFMREYRRVIKPDDVPTNDNVTPEEPTPDSSIVFSGWTLACREGQMVKSSMQLSSVER